MAIRISAHRVVSAVETSLGLLNRDGYTPGQAYERLAQVISRLQAIEGVQLCDDLTITTRAGVGEYILSERTDVGRILSVIWPSAWGGGNSEVYSHTEGSDVSDDGSPVSTPIWIHKNEYLAVVSTTMPSSTPRYWTHWVDSDARMRIGIAPASAVGEGLTITFHVEIAGYDEIGRDSMIPLPSYWEPYLIDALKAEMAEIYKPEMFAIFQKKSLMLLEEIRVRYSFTHYNEIKHFDNFWYVQSIDD